MDEHGECVVMGRLGEYRSPANFCRAVYLQIAARIARFAPGERAAKEVAKFFSGQAEGASGEQAVLHLWTPYPEGAGFASEERRALLLRAVEEVVASIEASNEAPENWNECPRWREWGIVKAKELRDFLRAENDEGQAHQGSAPGCH
jgi:hypothetical protein